MEQSGLTPKQKFIFQLLSQDNFFTSTFYLTGGTALSAFYLHHRESEDLDFFSAKSFSQEFIQSKLSTLGKSHNFSFTIRQIENVTIYVLRFSDPSSRNFLLFLFTPIQIPTFEAMHR